MKTSHEMPVNHLEVRRASADDRIPIYRMLELYQYDLSHIWDQELDARGEYGYALDRYWQEANCHPFVAIVNGHYAGFALVDSAVKIGSSGYWMDQFFVLKKYQRTGVGKALAVRVFAVLPGHWEVGQMPNNLPAQAFWRSVISKNTSGAYVEHTISSGWWQGIVQCFEHIARE